MAKLAAQFYTLRDYCTTEANFIDACKRVKKMGYDGIQLSCTVPLPAEEYKKILDGEGLECAASHVDPKKLENNIDEVADLHNGIGCKHIALGWFKPETWTRESWLAFTDRMNKLGAEYAKRGIRLGYHNHSFEFRQIDGIRVYDLLMKNFCPENIWLEIDTFWVQHGGADPADYIRRAAGRIPCVHLKDMVPTEESGVYQMTEIGDGNLNWPAILEACRYAGVSWYIVERDTGVKDPFDSLARSAYNLREKYGL